ncbi:methyltransferase domain-containing protein [Aspergillus alliaceus]|uniref:Methyltransferase domain-containing protein n=1 Tax=Petromyces alliaceus TaxID=209559 RepID=A0A5N6FJ25_PETAA|nr:methyltransferase domain-containing protein [Aspergillus alliaceus]KAB8229982.1 methyltransferase domain-containing protein [Aspergillus alliaceus]KAE8388752.1 methyltransferase domain-containing protein [Aspergillus alliaceus]
MSASRPGRSALKAKVPVPSPQRTGSRIPVDGLGKKPLPRRANPHLTNLRESQPRMSPRAMTILGVGVLGMSTYCGYLYASYRREVTHSQSMDVPRDVSDRYNQTARTFDADVEMSEKLMRMGKKRRDLVRQARGDVLEVSCGTGRNLEYYELGQRRRPDEKGLVELQGCRSVTFVDLSPQMVEIAREKFLKLHPGFKEASFQAQDAKDVAPSVPGEKRAYFDTVVQTMGLCSMPDPVGTLRHLGSITEPEKGRILLLEHGRSYYDWLNSILDNLAPAHADRHGCWWNRDIGEVVRQSGLEVIEEKRWHFGTTWKYVLKPATR